VTTDATALLPALLPAGVTVAEAFGDPEPAAPLFPEEAAHVARAVPERRREFATVRACARDALARLGGPRVPLLPGERGAPRWPAGYVGSMTHCRGYRAAAVARAGDVAGVGIDAEPDEPLRDPGVVELIALPAERAMLRHLAAARPGVAWERLLFSAKESVYKTWFPLTGAWLDFDQALIGFRPDDGTFTARLLVPGPAVNGAEVSVFEGRWRAGGGLLVTAICLPGRPPAG
jgi:4'-phosphopantetheinyl transferase EntD